MRFANVAYCSRPPPFLKIVRDTRGDYLARVYHRLDRERVVLPFGGTRPPVHRGRSRRRVEHTNACRVVGRTAERERGMHDESLGSLTIRRRRRQNCSLSTEGGDERRREPVRGPVLARRLAVCGRCGSRESHSSPSPAGVESMSDSASSHLRVSRRLTQSRSWSYATTPASSSFGTCVWYSER